jgi:hypothetical protein
MKTSLSTIKCTYRQLSALCDQFDKEEKVVPGVISKLAKIDENQVPAIKDRIHIGHFIRSVVSETVKYEQAHIELLKKHGQLSNTSDRPRYLITPEYQVAYRTDLQKLENTETEVSAFPLPASMLEKVSLSVSDLGALEPFLTLPGEEADITHNDKRSKAR